MDEQQYNPPQDAGQPGQPVPPQQPGQPAAPQWQQPQAYPAQGHDQTAGPEAPGQVPPPGQYPPQPQQPPQQYPREAQQPPQGQYPPQGEQPPGQYQQQPPYEPPQGQQYYQQPQPQYGGPAQPPPRRGMSRGSKILVGILLGILVIGALVGIGFVIDKTLFKSSASNFSLQDQPSYREALFDIKSYYFKPYVEAKIVTAANAAVESAKKKGVTSTTELTNTGITALVKALGDAHSEYLTPSENRRMEQDLSGSFFGVGFTLRLENVTGPNKGMPAPPPANGSTPNSTTPNSTTPNTTTPNNQQPVSPGPNTRPAVVSVIKGSPSEKAGIKPGDIIMSVDGQDTLGESLDAVVLRIRGKQGTKVDIKISRNGKPLDFVMTREKIQIPDFESELVDGKYGVLKLYEFNQGVGQKVRAAVKDLQAKGAQGFILDLRNDPGGLLDEAVQVASVLIPSGTIVLFQTKGQPKVDETAKGGAETDKPLVVLTNGGSASSSEIVTGALKDHNRAVLVGTKTYGKGSVQKVYNVGDGGAVKLTISLYYLPNGESIDGKGITPDIVVVNKNDPAAEETMQMDKAKQVLQNIIDGKPPNSLLVEVLLAA